MQVKTEKPDVDLKDVVSLSTYGRDEKYITNKLWLTGASTIMLYGVGDGMIPWCALKARIPIMCLYDREIHRVTIEKFLVEMVTKKMLAATPHDARWYRTDAQLSCRREEDDDAMMKAKAAAKAAAATAKAASKAKAEPKGKAAVVTAGTGKKRSSSSEGTSSSEESSVKRKRT